MHNVFDVSQLSLILQQIHNRFGRIHRLVGILEQLQEPLALLRERFSIEGMGVVAARKFRDKSTMKAALRSAGLPCARAKKVSRLVDAEHFAQETGFPLIVKPVDGAGCAYTHRVDSMEELRQRLRDAPLDELLIEEHLSGQEFSLETIVTNGEARLISCSCYLPSPLQVKQNRWMQWVVLFPKELDAPHFQRASELGSAALSALGLLWMTHMEWFLTPDGRIVIGEIGVRPPGAQITDGTGWVHNRNAHLAWAKAIVDNHFDGPWNREYAVAIAYLRAQQPGVITSITGLRKAQERVRSLVVDRQLPFIGARTSDSYEGDGWVILRHPSTEVVKRAALEVISNVRVIATAQG